MRPELNRKLSINVDLPWLPLALLIAFLLTLWFQGPRLQDPYAIEDDFRKFYWMQRFQEPELFPEDPMMTSRIRELELGDWTFLYDHSSPAYSLLLQLASYLVPVTLASKLLVFPLTLLSVYYIFALGRSLAGHRTAFALAMAFVILNLASPSAVSTTGGLQRSFVFPLLLALLHALMGGRNWRAAFVLFLSGLIYPPIFVLGVATYGLGLVRVELNGKRRLDIRWRELAPLLLAAFLVVLTLAPELLQIADRSQQAIQSDAPHILSSAQYTDNGRFDLFEIFPLVGRGGVTVRPILFIYIFILSLFTILIWFVDRRTLRDFPSVFKQLFFAGCLCFVAAWLGILLTSSFPLYLPSRYTQVSLLLFLLPFVVIHTDKVIDAGVRLVVEHRAKIIWLVLPLTLLLGTMLTFLPVADETTPFRSTTTRWLLASLVAILGLLSIIIHRRSNQSLPANVIQSHRPAGQQLLLVTGLLLLLISPGYIRLFRPDYYHASATERALFNFLQTLPDDSIVAGSPCLLDGVPLFAHRAALVTCERYDPTVAQKTLHAYYTANNEDLYQFCSDFGVDYLVVDRADFQEKLSTSGVGFVEPIKAEIEASLIGQTEFALNQIPSALVLWQAEDVLVLGCNHRLLEHDVD